MNECLPHIDAKRTRGSKSLNREPSCSKDDGGDDEDGEACNNNHGHIHTLTPMYARSALYPSHIHPTFFKDVKRARLPSGEPMVISVWFYEISGIFALKKHRLIVEQTCDSSAFVLAS